MKKRHITYNYKLNENFKRGDTLYLEGHKVQTHYTLFQSRMDVFEPYLRTRNNPEGILDYREYDALNNEEIFSSYDNFTTEPNLNYDRYTLSTYDRRKLEDIARSFDLNPIKKRNDFLIDLIIKAQEDYIKKQTEKE